MKTKALILSFLLTSPLAVADTGSEWLDAQVAQLQDEMAARNELVASSERQLIAQGYVVPETASESNDDSFNREMLLLTAAININK